MRSSSRRAGHPKDARPRRRCDRRTRRTGRRGCRGCGRSPRRRGHPWRGRRSRGPCVTSSASRPASAARRTSTSCSPIGLALAEVGAEQALLEGVLQVRARGRGEAGGGRRRCCRGGFLEVEVEAVLGGGRGHARDHLLRFGHAGAVLASETGGVRGSLGGARGGRVELEGVPDDLDGVPVRELLEGGLEPALADVTPGAGDVGPHVDTERLHGPEPKSEGGGRRGPR